MDEKYRQYLLEGERAGARYSLMIPREAMRGATGVRLGHGAGSSVDFKDYREYQPGDDLRRIDWGVFGRTDKLIVKLYREEVTPHLDILLDVSGSMALPESAKPRGLLGLAAILASSAANANCSHAAWLAAEGFQPVANGTGRPSEWDALELAGARTPAEAFSIMPPRLRRNGIRVLIGDLLWPEDPLETLRPLADGAAALIVIQVLAETDVHPPMRGNVRLVDVETGVPLEVFVDALAQKRYTDALARHQQNWHQACRQVGAVLALTVAEEIADAWRLDTLEAAQILGVA